MDRYVRMQRLCRSFVELLFLCTILKTYQKGGTMLNATDFAVFGRYHMWNSEQCYSKLAYGKNKAKGRRK